MTEDSALLDWLDDVTHKGWCPALVFDDNGFWAVSFEGGGPAIWGDAPWAEQITISVEVEPGLWRPTAREAIAYARAAASMQTTESPMPADASTEGKT
jgi:hypothetical protein